MTENHRARRLPKHAGPAAWDVILGPASPLPVLDHELTADVAIIGGGFAGLSAARRLLQLDPQLKVVLLEAGRIAEGAAGRNSGFMIDLPHELTSSNYAGDSDSGDRKTIALNRKAIAFASEAVQEYGIDPNYFEQVGKTNGAASSASIAQNHSYAEHLSNLGEPCELLDQQAMFEMTGSRHYLSGLYTPGTVMLQPAGYIRGLAQGLSRDAMIFQNSPVSSFQRNGDGWDITTPKGAVSAGQIILANNGHLESFGFMKRRLMHIFLFACMTKELDAETMRRLGGRSRWGITPSDPMGTTVRRIDTGQGGNRLVLRTCAEFCPDMQTNDSQMRRAAAIMRRKFTDRFPMIADVTIEHVWAGHLCLSLNGVSVGRELDDGLYAACCQNGLGTTRGTLTGMAAAEQALDMPGELSAFFTSQDQPRQLLPEPFAKLGATAVMRFKEWRARRE